MYNTIADLQRKLDEIIITKHNLIGADLYSQKKIWLLVELGELANEIRFFKYASRNQKPNIFTKCSYCHGTGANNMIEDNCIACEGTGTDNTIISPVLEEYVDVLHLIMSIYLNHDKFSVDFLETVEPLHYTDFISHFESLFSEISSHLYTNIEYVFRLIIGIGSMLKFSDKEVLEAYKNKHLVNMIRQSEGY